MNNNRLKILNRLRKSQRSDLMLVKSNEPSCFAWDADEKICRFIERMETVRTEVHNATQDTWLTTLQDICQTKHLRNLLLSSTTQWGKKILKQTNPLPILRNYSQSIEEWKQEMFNGIDAAFTGTYGGIAETGTLILWPDAHELRLMSLVPPVHIALLEKTRIYSTFAEAVQALNWVGAGMPANALLISGPSKSTDIEHTLTYGVHGPKELVVILA